MTIEIKRYIPYSLKELYKGIRRKDLDANWRLVLLKSQERDDTEDFDLILEHKKTKLKTTTIEISNKYTEDKRGNPKGYVYLSFPSRCSFRCIYGPKTDNIFKALSMSLRNPEFVMELYNLKTKRTPFQYCSEKFGPIFDDLRCSQWQLHS
jgi:hypothetical protein